MNLYLNKAQSKKLILDHIQEELTTEEFCSLLMKLIKLYKQFVRSLDAPPKSSSKKKG